MTIAETMLWRGLRIRRLGWKFRRQVPFGPFIADFVCIVIKLIIELDGPPHENPQQQLHDRRRDIWLRAHGWHILRFPNDQVTGGGDIVLGKIEGTIAAIASTRDLLA